MDGRKWVVIAGCLVAAGGGGVCAAEEPTAQDAVREASRWRLRVEPSAWYVGPGGEVDMPNGSVSSGAIDPFKLSDLGIDTPRVAPMLEAHVSFNDTWRLGFRGFTLSADGHATSGVTGAIGEVAIAPTSVVNSSLDYDSFEAELGWSVHRYQDPKGNGLSTNLELLALVQVIDFDWSIRRLPDPTLVFLGPDSQGVDEFYVIPEVGFKFTMNFGDDFTVDALGSVGAGPWGNAAAYTGDVILGFTWQPWENAGVQVGYRSAFFSLYSGGDGDQEFSYSGAQQGLYFGAVVEF